MCCFFFLSSLPTPLSLLAVSSVCHSKDLSFCLLVFCFFPLPFYGLPNTGLDSRAPMELRLVQERRKKITKTRIEKHNRGACLCDPDWLWLTFNRGSSLARGTGLVRGDHKGTASQSGGRKVRTTRRDSIERASSCVQIICQQGLGGIGYF